MPARGMHLFLWLHVMLLVNEIFLWNSCSGQAHLFFELTEDIGSPRLKNMSVFQTLIGQVSSSKKPPTGKDKDKIQLLKILGNAYNPRHHSISKPNELNLVYTEKLTEDRLVKSMPEELATEMFELKGLDTNLKLHTKARKYIQLYLQMKSSCPISYHWHDLGEFVWPQYFKETFCTAKPCSYPDGMTCGPSAGDMEQVAMLYWNCHARVKKSGAMQCGWSTIRIRVDKKCVCACQDL